jgi:hypothetical protein
VISAGVTVAVPAIAFMANGEINMEFIGLGR